MSIYEIIQDNQDGTYTLWGTFDHHSLVDALPYFMKMNDPEALLINHDGKALHLTDVYYFFKKEGRYD